MTDLQTATIQELIDELVSRDTFRGLVAWQKENFKGQDREDWSWRSHNCDPVSVCEQIAERLQ